MWGGLGNCFCCFEGVFEVKRGELVFLDVSDCRNFFQILPQGGSVGISVDSPTNEIFLIFEDFCESKFWLDILHIYKKGTQSSVESTA